MDFNYMIVAFVAFIVGQVLGRAAARAKFRQTAKDLVLTMVYQSEQYLGMHVVPVRIERIESTYFMYEMRAPVGFINAPSTGEVFVAQGKTKYELVANARAAKPGALFYVQDFNAIEIEKNEVL